MWNLLTFALCCWLQSSATILSALIFILTMLVNMFHDHLGLVWYKHPLVLVVNAFLCCPLAQEDPATPNFELLRTGTRVETAIIRYNLFEMTISVATLGADISSRDTREWKLKEVSAITAKPWFFSRPVLEWFSRSRVNSRTWTRQRLLSSVWIALLSLNLERATVIVFLEGSLKALDYQFPCFTAIERSGFWGTD